MPEMEKESELFVATMMSMLNRRSMGSVAEPPQPAPREAARSRPNSRFIYPPCIPADRTGGTTFPPMKYEKRDPNRGDRCSCNHYPSAIRKARRSIGGGKVVRPLQRGCR